LTRRASIGVDRVLGALEDSGQAGAIPEDVGKDGIFEAPVVGEAPLPVRINSAVLVPLFEEASEARLVLTRRSTDLRTHQGQVSFPGGRLDEGEDAVGAALRESFEEIGLDPAVVTTVGWLHPLLTMVSASFILPVLGVLDGRPGYVVNHDEVERVFDVALSELADPEIFHEERWRIPGRAVTSSEDGSFPVWFFEISGELIWGATARMLHELLSVVLLKEDGG
jgi:8-oxo-dGTP pyrophosphatase MutT (NUDIX family)